MVCANCGATNRAGAKFCINCAASLAAACPTCGTVNPPQARFCEECATPLAAAPAARPAPAAAAPGGETLSGGASGAFPTLAGEGARQPAPTPSVTAAERRLVSVLFVDLVGFTPFSEERDAEDVRETLSRYFDVATDVVTRHGGKVDKFIGDAVTAVWGAPTAREDDAERAVRAGLELVDAVRALGPGIQARAGVLTGEAAVGFVGSTNQGLVVGDLVNTASRLQSVAPPGTVLVGEATQRSASKSIVFEPAGEQVLKGKSAPVPAWRAVRVVAERGGRNRSESVEAPFVGREDELRLLKELFHASSRERRARLVSVIGPAGIGKTRLAWEFVKYVDGLVEKIWWHDGRSPAYGEGISFWALGEMVRSRCGLLETDDEATTRGKVAETLATHVPDPDERRWIEPAILALLGIGGGIGSEQLFGAWRTFFERLADTAPVVMVLEDFHYADSGLIDFVDHLLEWSRTSPIYVMTLARPDLLEKRPNWGAGKRNFHSVYLEPLAEPAMRELLLGLVPGLPERAARSIVARADGVPLYAIETIRMLVAEGRLTEKDGVYQPVGDLTSLAVPETLTALIASRLDGLAPEDRALVSDAAVIGQSFTLAGLAAVSGEDAGSLEARLLPLVRRELLSVDVDPRSPERGQYRFVQALIREVAYNTLSKRDRASRHLAAARHFEALGTDELAGALAGHYLAAHANTADGPERDALGGQARLALRGAAQRAVALGSHEQALSFYEQALTVTIDRAERAALMERAGDAASDAGLHEAAERLLRAAVEEQRAIGEPALVARAIAALGRALLNEYKTADALALLEPAAAELEPLATDPAVIAVGGQLARAHMLADDMEASLAVADRVLAAAERQGHSATIADTLITKGTVLGSVGRPIEGLGVLQAGEQLAEQLGLGKIVARAQMNHTSIEAARNPRAALEVARAGIVLTRRLGLRHQTVMLLGNGVEDAFRTGDWAWALAELEASLADDHEAVDRMILLQTSTYFLAARGEQVDDRVDEIARFVSVSGDSQVRVSRDLARAMAAFARGDLEACRDAWLTVAEISIGNLPDSLSRACRAAVWMGDVSAAREYLARLEAAGLQGPALAADKQTMRAMLAALEGRPAEALAGYREAIKAWRSLGLLWDEALAGIDMAKLLDPGIPDVRQAVARSREILAELGATPFLALLDRAPAEPGRAAAVRDEARAAFDRGPAAT